MQKPAAGTHMAGQLCGSSMFASSKRMTSNFHSYAPLAHTRLFSQSAASMAKFPVEVAKLKEKASVLQRQLGKLKRGKYPERHEKLKARQARRNRAQLSEQVAELNNVLFRRAKLDVRESRAKIKLTLGKPEGMANFVNLTGTSIQKIIARWAGIRIPHIENNTSNTDCEALSLRVQDYLNHPDHQDKFLEALPESALFKLETFGILSKTDIRRLQDLHTGTPEVDETPTGPVNSLGPTPEVDETTTSPNNQYEDSSKASIHDDATGKETSGLNAVKPLIRFRAHNYENKRRYTTSTASSSAAPPPLPHLTADSKVHMVSVDDKPVTARQAIAIAIVRFSNPSVLAAILKHRVAKGDVLAVSRIAGIMGAKKTAEIVPLCHPGLQITHAEVEVEAVEMWTKEAKHPTMVVELPEGMTPGTREAKLWLAKHLFMTRGVGQHGGVKICAKIACSGRTGVEMEALTAASTAALTVIDMCKALDKGLDIISSKVVYKDGGRSGTYVDETWAKAMDDR